MKPVALMTSSVIITVCFMLILLGTILFVDLEKPKPLVILVPAAIMAWVAFYNIAVR